VLLTGWQSAGTAASPENAAVSVNISVSPLTALQIFGVAMLLASVAGVISVSRITTYEPIKILMKRN
jgi:putative ABC transport system permease protein